MRERTGLRQSCQFNHCQDIRQGEVYDLPRIFCVSDELFRMSLTRAQVEGIAHLARLEISEAQMPVYVDSLSRIIDFVEQLSAADTGGVEPMAHPLADQVQRLRPDAVTETDQHEKFQRNASSVAAGLYLVPKVIE
jgi:aspartyl-tRNA(Asn)/glutamyl-tRNA(Gln) amidotransferase subunit C